MILNELFNQPLPWKWDKASSGDGEEYAAFSTETTPYHVSFVRHDGADAEADVWSVEFGVDGVTPDKSMGVTGTGDAAIVFATVVDIIRAFMRTHRAIFLVFSAGGISRVKLYDRMARTLSPKVEIERSPSGYTLYRIKT
jgi:hypothetical protein